MSEEITSKPMFSAKEVIQFMTLVLVMIVQHFALKQEIHDTVVEMGYNRKEFVQYMADNNKRVDGLDNKYDFLVRGQVQPAMKPKEIEIESDDKKGFFR